MENDRATNEGNALKILAMAAEQYLKVQDELSRNFVGPQVRAAVEVIGAILEERNGAPVATVVPAEEEGKKAK
jgi:cellobiose-specific phosphotransferase system component IIB